MASKRHHRKRKSCVRTRPNIQCAPTAYPDTCYGSDGTYSHYNMNGDVLTKNVDAEKVQNMLNSNLLKKGKLIKDSKAKKAIEDIKTAVGNAWDKAKDTVKSGWDSFASFITGGKTGYTLEAGRCLASIATDTENNINYLLVTTNASNTPDHILDAHDIYKYYFQNYKYHTILKKGTDLVDIKVIDSDIKNIKFKAKKDITKYLDNTFNINNVKIKYDGLDILSYKNKKGEKVGTIKLIYNDDVIDKFDIILDTEIKFNLFVYIFANSLRRTIFFGFVLLIIFIVIIKRKKTTN